MRNDKPSSVASKWVALAGNWEFADGRAQFKSPQTGPPPLGLALSNLRLKDGVVRCSVRLSRTREFSAAIAVGMHGLTDPYVTFGFGNFDKAYSITSYIPGQGWIQQAGAGSLDNLKPDQQYHILVDLKGQFSRLVVDDIEVLRYHLSPLKGSGVGLFAWGDSTISFDGLDAQVVKPKVFVVMPFAEPYNTLYNDVIRRQAEELCFEISRVDEIAGPGIVLDDIRMQIEQSHLIIAEVTSANPNVFYELGYAHALEKPSIILCKRESGKVLPFDIRRFRVIFYDDTIGGKSLVEESLSRALAAVRGE